MPFVNTSSLIDDIASGVIPECYIAQDIHIDKTKKDQAAFLASGFVINKNNVNLLHQLLNKGFTNIPIRFYKQSETENDIISITETPLKIQENLKNTVVNYFNKIHSTSLDNKDKFDINVGRILDKVLNDVLDSLINNPNIELCLKDFSSVNDLEGHAARVTYLCGYVFFHLVDYLTDEEKKFRKSSNSQLKDNLYNLLKSAILHDIGKLQLDQAIINRKTRLLEDDLKTITEKLNNFNISINKDELINSIRSISDCNMITLEQRAMIDQYLHGKNIMTDEQYRRLTLDRKGNLLPEEMKEIEKHTLNGWILMSKWDLPVPRVVALMHHRFYDGTGYPTAYLDGRPTPIGKNIHVFARILNIIDVYDALITDRPYRGAFHPLEALWLMRDMYQKNKFDPDIFKIFYRVIKPFQVGDEVFLSNGFRALIYGHNKNCRLRPKIVAIIDKKGNRISPRDINNYKINLEDDQYKDIYILKHLGKDVTEFTGSYEKDLQL